MMPNSAPASLLASTTSFMKHATHNTTQAWTADFAHGPVLPLVGHCTHAVSDMMPNSAPASLFASTTSFMKHATHNTMTQL